MEKIYIEQILYKAVIERGGKFFMDVSDKEITKKEMADYLERYKGSNIINQPTILNVFYYILKGRDRTDSVVVFERDGTTLKRIAGKPTEFFIRDFSKKYKII